MAVAWLYGVLIALIAVQLFAAYASVRTHRTDGTALGDETDAVVDESAEVVSCPSCGAENDLGYRFCRQCVGELPVSSPYPTKSGAPRGRGMF